MITFEITNRKFYCEYSDSAFSDQCSEEFKEESFVEERFEIMVFDDEPGYKMVQFIVHAKTKAIAVRWVRSEGYNLTRADISNKNVKIVKSHIKNR